MSHGSGSHRTVSVEGIARVEGEGSLRVEVRDGDVRDVALSIFEPPRFFESLLRGRDADQAPDITARICGICPVAYQMSACTAVEDVSGVEVGPRITALRRLLYLGEWIQSHAFHIYLLHAPDFMGCTDAVELAERDRDAVLRGLSLKRVGNQVMEMVGGRAVHPVNVRVGGFFTPPTADAVASLAAPLRQALEDAVATVNWVGGFEFPPVHADYRFVSSRSGDSYPLLGGRIVSSDGLDTTPAGFAELVTERHQARSTARQARLPGGPYLTGPMARYTLNRDLLPVVAREAAEAAGLPHVCTNPFQSIVVRSVELVAACHDALALVEDYRPPEPAAVVVPRQAGVGTGATEAPRGLLLHQYRLEDDGTIEEARILAPTAQNQLAIEDDLRVVARGALDAGDEELGRRCERAVRNHDPCISCAAHFLDVEVVR